MVINESLIREMINEGKEVVDGVGNVYSVSRDSESGYWGLSTSMEGKGGSWSPFSKRITDKTISRMADYMKRVWNWGCGD